MPERFPVSKIFPSRLRGRFREFRHSSRCQLKGQARTVFQNDVLCSTLGNHDPPSQTIETRA
jgi:hypothetical protein